MLPIPSVITHNYDARRGAFQNICALPRGEAEAILSEIREAGLARLRPNYLERRLETERWLFAERVKKIGTPRLVHPIYFFLGAFADGRDPARPTSLVLPLAALPPESLTFTYPDSMASLPLGTAAKHRAERRPYHGQVFTLAEIEDVVAEFGLPSVSVEDETLRRPFIEVQVWDDRSLRTFLADQGKAVPISPSPSFA